MVSFFLTRGINIADYCGLQIISVTIGEIRVMGHSLINILVWPLIDANAMLRQSVVVNSPFRGIGFCNLGTSKTVISNFVTTRQIIVTPYSSP